MNEVVHNYGDAAGFLREYQACFATRADGSSWPNWETTWQRGAQYFRGLIRPGNNKSIAGIASMVDIKQEKLERFVRESAWEYENVEEHLRQTVPEAAQGAASALILDGMGIPKQGHDSVAVGHQWCGATGKMDNCQVTINLTLASPGQHRNADQVSWPLGMRLYTPKKWIGDDPSVYDSSQQQQQYTQRRADAEIPENLGYKPKHEIGGDLVEAAANSDLDFGCVLGDSNFGKSPTLRRRLRKQTIPYALELVPSKFPVVTEETPLQEESESGSSDPDETHWEISDDAEIFSPEDLAQEVEDKNTDPEWEHLDWAEGTKETLSGDFYRKRVRVVTDRAAREVGEETGWLLIERTTDEDEDNSTVSVKAWICWDLDDSSLEELVQWTHLRWSIERFHRDIKQHLGADEFQGRSWDGFHRHLAVVMLAHAFIATHRLETEQNLPSFEDVMQRIVREAAIQQLQDNLNFDRQTAIDAAEEMLQGFTDWRIPEL
jgi:FOG: Transposase